ncbi:Ger(x)C family spore germination protein [Bacillus timonensis]|nr:Ger(x)C family spore germination protein [Bacillus timonensis]
MRKNKNRTKLLFICIIAFFLTGCWDKTEVEEKAYVIGLGLDKAEEENKMEITFLIANPEVGTLLSGGSSSEPPHEIITITANDFISARNTANTVVAKALAYPLLKVIVVSEEFAKDDNFIRHIYDTTKDREIRRDIRLLVSREKARVFFEENKPRLETRPHKYFQFITNRGVETGMIPDSDLHKFYKVTEGDADLFLAIYTSTQNKSEEENQKKASEDEFLAGELDTKGKKNTTQFIGSAVFKEGKMIGKLNGEETRVALLLDPTSDVKDILTTYPDPFKPEYRIASRVIKTKENIVSIELGQGPPKIDIKMFFVVEVLSDPAMINYAKDFKKQEKLKKYLEENISKKMEKVINKTQEEFKGEPFLWSIYARKQFMTIPEYEKFDWMKSYPNADVSVSVAVNLGEFGKQTKVVDLEEMRD